MQFCTISSTSHLYKAYALAESISIFGGFLHILITNKKTRFKPNRQEGNIQFHSLEEIKSLSTNQLINKYKGDKLRWGLKSGFLLHLLERPEMEKIIYIDSDIYFFNDPSFLFDKLDTQALLLSPHFYPSNPNKNQNWLETNFRLGLYNAGFIGASKQATEALKWWEQCCLYKMKRAYFRGLFDDQKYLDMLPILFNKVEVLKDRGCNLAAWNDNVSIESRAITFVHFNEYTLKKFGQVKSSYHWAFLKYIKTLRKYLPSYEPNTNVINWFKIKNHIIYLIWKVEQALEK